MPVVFDFSTFAASLSLSLLFGLLDLVFLFSSRVPGVSTSLRFDSGGACPSSSLWRTYPLLSSDKTSVDDAEGLLCSTLSVAGTPSDVGPLPGAGTPSGVGLLRVAPTVLLVLSLLACILGQPVCL